MLKREQKEDGGATMVIKIEATSIVPADNPCHAPEKLRHASSVEHPVHHCCLHSRDDNRPHCGSVVVAVKTIFLQVGGPEPYAGRGRDEISSPISTGCAGMLNCGPSVYGESVKGPLNALLQP